MKVSAAQFSFDAPAGYLVEETTLGLRSAHRNGPSPSFIVNTRPTRPGSTLESLASEVVAELAQTIGQMKAPSRTEFTFEDGHKGLLVAHALSTQSGPLRQYFLLRLHEGQLCTITLTVPEPALNEASAPLFMKSLASLKTTP